VGTTVVIWTAEDACHNSITCQQNVTVLGQICASKYYDANANGNSAGDLPIPGWKMVVTNLAGGTPLVGYTGANGSVCFDVPVGNYSVTEVAPSSNWVATTQPCVVTIAAGSCTGSCSFGNYCFNPPTNGYTLGFWSNKNGQALITAGDLTALGILNLRDASGNNFDPASGAELETLRIISPIGKLAPAEVVIYWELQVRR
jgi:hypothetical protein